MARVHTVYISNLYTNNQDEAPLDQGHIDALSFPLVAAGQALYREDGYMVL